MKHIAFLILLLSVTTAYGQYSFKAKIVDKETGEPLYGATVKISDTKGSVANVDGYVEINDIKSDSIEVTISFVSYQTFTKVYRLPLTQVQDIRLQSGEELEEIVVTSTRSSRVIDDIPTRVEVISTEELEEKAIMRSANIAMVLRESTGIQMQITSASSANQSIRIQGLDGRYTQILKDGFQLFGGFSSGLSIMQIPPLDLKQVEVIKGSNSTLYGGGAIAGLVNLVSLTPDDGNKIKFMVDQTSAGGTTLNGFYSRKFNKTGFTLFASANRQEAYDPNNDDFSDIPQIRSLTLNPSFFYYINDQSQFRLTLNSTLENRLGGDMEVIDGGTNGIHQFTEENESDRFSYQLSYENDYNENKSLKIKNSLTFFDRKITEPDFTFAGKQWYSFTEITYSSEVNNSTWISGLNIYTDNFNETPFDSLNRDYSYTTVGLFTQNTFDLSRKTSVESGLRLDYDIDYGLFALPRISLLTRLSGKLSLRVGGGFGYKLPTIFTEEAESQTYENILPIDFNQIDVERSLGGNLDFNYKTVLGNNWTLSVNQLFFYTNLSDALVLEQNNQGQFVYDNANDQVISRGLETNVKLTYKHFKLFANYALINTRFNSDDSGSQKPLTPRHNIGAVLVYEEEGKWRIGFESYYTGQQFRVDRTQTDDYWIVGFLAMRKFENLSIYINFENFTDTRQHRLEDFRIGTHIKPDFPEIWAPTDGSVVNAGFILEL